MNEIEEINERNKRVELDKAWETSVARRSTIAALTYVVVCVFLFVIKDSNPFVHALVPVAGYLLSTVSLPFMKQWWVKRQVPKI